MKRTLPILFTLFITSLLAAQADPTLSLSPSLDGISLIVIKIPRAHILLTSTPDNILHIEGNISSDTEATCNGKCTISATAQNDILTVTPFIPKGKAFRHLRRHLWFDLQIVIPSNVDIRLVVTYGDVAINGPFLRKLIVRLRDGLITYHLAQTPPHELEAKAVFGKVTSKIPGVLVRPFFPFGKRLFVLTPDGRGSVYLRTTKGRVGIEP